MARNLTKKRIEKYLINPNKCPFCGSTLLVVTDTDFINDTVIDRLITCDGCSETFIEKYKLETIYNKEN